MNFIKYPIKDRLNHIRFHSVCILQLFKRFVYGNVTLSQLKIKTIIFFKGIYRTIFS